MKILQQYEDNLRVLRGLDDKTIKSYKITAEIAIELLGEDVASWNMMDIQTLVVHLSKKYPNLTTYNKHIMSLKIFIKFLVHYKINKDIDLDAIKSQVKSKRVKKNETHGQKSMPTENFEGFLDMVYNINDTIYTQRKKVAILVMMSTGLRRIECSTLRKEDIFQDEDGNYWVNPSTTKFSKEREGALFMQQDIIDEIFKLYALYEKNNIIGEYVFMTNTGEVMCESGINRLVTSVAEMAKRRDLLPKEYNLTPHSLRKSYAVYLHKVLKVDLNTIRMMLGHTSIVQTQIYLTEDESGNRKTQAEIKLPSRKG